MAVVDFIDVVEAVLGVGVVFVVVGGGVELTGGQGHSDMMLGV